MLSLIPGHPAARKIVLKPAVAFPAIAGPVDFFNGGFMTPGAVGLNRPFSVQRKSNRFRHSSGIKNKHIFHSIDRLPGIISADIFVWEMAVNASDASMSACMEPCFKLRLHNMAGSAKIRSFGFCHELRRPEHDKKSACRRKQNNCQNNFSRP